MIANDNNRPETSKLTAAPPFPGRGNRSLRRLWFLLAIPLAAGALTVSVASAHGFRGGEGRGPGAFMEGRMEKLLDAAEASDAQKTQIKAVWEPLRPQLQTLHKQQRELRQQIGEAVAAATIDPARVEQLRKQSVQTMDQTSALMTQGMLASAKVLTPEQRKKVLTKLEERRGHHRGAGK